MINIDKYINKSFYNPFLKSVAVEIRFPATVRVIKDFLEFQEAINEEYPNFAEEHPFLDFTDKIKAPENLRKYEFSDNKNKNKVRISMNAIAIITEEYRKYEIFSGKINWIIEKFINSFNIKNCLRIGLRYINVYPLSSELSNSMIELEPLFIPFINTELIPFKQIFGQNIEVRRNLSNNNKITLRSRLNFNKVKNIFQYILDFDAYYPDKIIITDYQKKLADLRKVEKACFLLSVTEDFMSKMDFID